MSATIQVDMREYNKTLKQYLAKTSKDAEFAINQKGVDLIFGGRAGRNAGVLGLTPRVKGPQITQELNQTRTMPSGKRTTLGALIVQERSWKSQKIILSGKQTEEAVRSMKFARRKSVGFAVSGWLAAGEDMMRAIGRNFTARISGRKKGKGLPASKRLIEVTVQNEVRFAQTLALPALEKAFRLQTADMERYLTGTFQKTADKMKISKG